MQKQKLGLNIIEVIIQLLKQESRFYPVLVQCFNQSRNGFLEEPNRSRRPVSKGVQNRAQAGVKGAGPGPGPKRLLLVQS